MDAGSARARHRSTEIGTVTMIRYLPLALVFSAACVATSDDSSGAAASDTTVRPTVVDSIAADSADAMPAAPDTAMVVRFDGLGPLRVGMTEDEARAALGDLKAPASAVEPNNPAACRYGTTTSFPHTRVMLEGGKVVRVEVDSAAGIPTAEGARVGDTEARVQEIYPGRVQVQPHKYTTGHYLVVRPAGADTTKLIVFETDGTRTLRMRAGQRPQVEYVEGCN